jgi:hypothetical protein
MTISLTSELELLIAACKSDADFAATHHRLKGKIDWTHFGMLARAHKLGALAATRLKRANLQDVPEATSLMLEAYRREIVTRNLAQEVGTVKVINLLAMAGIRALAFKGVAAAHTLHGDVRDTRVSSDIDILVSADDFHAAEAAFKSANYRKHWPEFEVTPRAQPMLMSLAHAFTWISPDLGLAIELHHRLSHNPYWFDVRFDRLWEASEEVQLQGGNIRTLGPADMAAYMCCHAVDHGYFVLKWVDDAARAVSRADRITPYPNWLPAELKAAAAVDQALQLIRVLHAGRGDEVASTLPADKANSRIVDAISQIEKTDFGDENRHLSDLPRELIGAVRRTGLGGSWKAAWHDILGVLVDPRDVRTLGLGLYWQPFYAASGLPFAAWRYLNRPKGSID